MASVAFKALKYNTGLVLKSVNCHLDYFHKYSQSHIARQRFTRIALEKDGLALQYVDWKVRSKELVLVAVRENPLALQYAAEFRTDEDVLNSMSMTQIRKVYHKMSFKHVTTRGEPSRHNNCYLYSMIACISKKKKNPEKAVLWKRCDMYEKVGRETWAEKKWPRRVAVCKCKGDRVVICKGDHVYVPLNIVQKEKFGYDKAMEDYVKMKKHWITPTQTRSSRVFPDGPVEVIEMIIQDRGSLEGPYVKVGPSHWGTSGLRNKITFCCYVEKIDIFYIMGGEGRPNKYSMEGFIGRTERRPGMRKEGDFDQECQCRRRL